jgi:single-strand DNA-binding protein
MSYNYNQATLVGRLTKDPELKALSTKSSKLSFTLAVNRQYKKPGEEAETDFIPVTLFGHSAILGEKLLRKGTPALVWGRIQVRSYEKDEERRWMTEIVAENFQLLDRFPDIKSEFEKQEAETA